MKDHIVADGPEPTSEELADLEELHDAIWGALKAWDERRSRTPEYRAHIFSNVVSNLLADYILGGNDTLERITSCAREAIKLKSKRGNA